MVSGEWAIEGIWDWDVGIRFCNWFRQAQPGFDKLNLTKAIDYRLPTVNCQLFFPLAINH
jgi:hypothetical protein